MPHMSPMFWKLIYFFVLVSFLGLFVNLEYFSPSITKN